MPISDSSGGYNASQEHVMHEFDQCLKKSVGKGIGYHAGHQGVSRCLSKSESEEFIVHG